MSDAQRCAIVTVSSRGIGAAVAERLAADGLAVVVNHAGTAVARRTDVGDAGEVAAMFEAAEAAFRGVDVLVNNAGIMKLAPLAEVGDDLVDAHLSVNLKGTINALREAARALQDGGRIVNLSSSVFGLYQPTYGIYAATKAGVEALTHILAKALGARGITVNAVAPGPTATSLFLDDEDQATIDRIAKAAPLGRLGQPADVAAVVAFLVGPDGGWINGQALRANGGVVWGGGGMTQIILITGTPSGFGSLTARTLAEAGHTVYASMRGTTGRNTDEVAEDGAAVQEIAALYDDVMACLNAGTSALRHVEA